MTKQKSTKRALLMSGLALLMCVSMLIGSTFAWFTDSVTSGVNKITAGNLDVELDYYTDSEWKTVSNATELFTGNLWEPGHTEVVYLRMTNKGTLAVKYQLGVNIVSETTGTNVYDDTFKLSDYIYYDVIENKQPSYADRADAIADVNDEAKINEVYSKSGTMTTQNEELYLALVVYMPETVGNEANYKTGATAPEINLGINLLATQYTYESDSFNNQYDKDAIYYDVSVNDSESLAAAVKAGKEIIAIDGSIILTSSMNASGVTFIGMSDDASIDFGTNGISGSDIIYQNLTLDNDRNGWYEGMEYGNALNNTYINCKFANGITTYGNSTFKGCTFNELPAGNYALFAYAGSTITVEDCVFNYSDRAIKIYNEGYTPDVKMTVSNTDFEASDTTVANKAMIEIDDSLMDSVKVTVTDITIDGSIAAQGVYRINDGDLNASTANSVVTVDGTKTVVSTAEQLTVAIGLGGTVVLSDDIVMTESIWLANVDFVLDGCGHTITMADDATNIYALFDINGGRATIKNINFDGIKGGAVVRTVHTEFIADKVTVENCEITQVNGLFRLLGKSTVTDCTFRNNTCNMVISLNWDGANEDPQVVQGCVFENNICNSTAVLYYVKGAGATIDGNRFVGNTVNCTDNGATVYIGFTENNVVTNNVFENNTVNEAGTSDRVAGALMVGYDAKITGNSFVGNRVTGENAKGNDVCVSPYYCDIDLSGNYWGGSAPVANDDYYQEYDNYSVIIDSYLTEYDD